MVFCISENIFLQWPWDSQHGFKLKQTRNILSFVIKIECRKHHSHFLSCPLVSKKKTPQNKWKTKVFLKETLKNQFHGMNETSTTAKRKYGLNYNKRNHCYIAAYLLASTTKMTTNSNIYYLMYQQIQIWCLEFVIWNTILTHFKITDTCRICADSGSSRGLRQFSLFRIYVETDYIQTLIISIINTTAKQEQKTLKVRFDKCACAYQIMQCVV